jgi:hypothetical protein
MPVARGRKAMLRYSGLASGFPKARLPQETALLSDSSRRAAVTGISVIQPSKGYRCNVPVKPKVRGLKV